MQVIHIYTKDYYPYCQRAKDLLEIKGLDYTEIDVSYDTELETQMRQRSGRHTVPQIFFGDRHVGGCDDLFALDEQGQLNLLLEAVR
jgi:glutaredoxin 3